MLATVAVVIGGTWVSFEVWKDQLRERLILGATVVETTQGDVEYARLGAGRTFAVLHGTPGGYDQVIGAPDFVPNNLALLAISRPGYLRTPIDSGRTPEQQADLLAALMDEVGLKTVVVMGVSGGGLAALQFALRHPDRCDALVLLSARTRSHRDSGDDDDPSFTDRLRAVFGTDFLIWAFGDRIAQSFGGQGELDQETQARLRTVVNSSALIDDRAVGRANDIANLTDPRIDDWPLVDVTVPTLIVYGVEDPGVSPAESTYAGDLIPGAELVAVPGGHFVGATDPDRVRGEIESWLERGVVLQDVP